MKNFSYNLLKQLNAKKADKGFTLIELLVVIIIIGILSAIALPAFLNQASKAKQSEAKQALGAVNRGQQAYRLENVAFAPTIAFLALGLETDTNNYLYSDTIGGTVGSFDSGDYTVEASIFADAKDDAAVRTYEASVGASIDPEGNATTITVLCEGLTPGDVPAIVYTPVAGTTEASFACGADAKQL